MRLGFVSAIMPELNLTQILDEAAARGYDSVEVMSWPVGKKDRRYGGVTHVDVSDFTEAQADDIHALEQQRGVEISGLGYYPNLLSPVEEERTRCLAHLKDVVRASHLLGLDTVNTFIGRDWKKSVEENWPMFLSIWPDLVRYAEDYDVRFAIENCPMYFTADEWPGGKNLMATPAMWDRIFSAIPSKSLGLTYDPSHLLWQGQDYFKPLQAYRDKIFRVHAKDAVVHHEQINKLGLFAHPNEIHSPVLPGRGEIDWPKFFSVLKGNHYDGFITLEIEDTRYETLQQREWALVECASYLQPLLS